MKRMTALPRSQLEQFLDLMRDMNAIQRRHLERIRGEG